MFLNLIKKWRKKRRDRIYEGPCIDGGTRISNDIDAPKEITSDTLVKLSCRYSTLSLIDECEIPVGDYKFTATRENDGAGCTAECIRGSLGGKKISRKLPCEVLDRIAALIKEHGIESLNGRYYKVSGLPDFYGASIDAEYESGETLYCYNNQDPIIPIEFAIELYRIFGMADSGDE